VAEPWEGVRITVLSDVKYLEPIRAVVNELTGLAGFDETEGHEVLLAVQEACTNVIRHCYKNCPDERIDVVLTFRDDALLITIDDYGEFVDPAQMQGRELEDVRPGGLGLHLMRTVMDEVDYRKNQWGGTTLTLLKRLPQGSRREADGGVDAEF